MHCQTAPFSIILLLILQQFIGPAPAPEKIEIRWNHADYDIFRNSEIIEVLRKHVEADRPPTEAEARTLRANLINTIISMTKNEPSDKTHIAKTLATLLDRRHIKPGSTDAELEPKAPKKTM